MGEYLELTLSRVPARIQLPEPLRLLFAWIEDQGFVHRSPHDGELYGALGTNYYVGTQVELRGYPSAEASSYLHAWFGGVEVDLDRWLWPFAKTGGEGSVAALWLAVDGVTRIVHLGSGSGSVLTCVLAEDAVDFLRLLAIGYTEICWNREFASPPVARDEDGEVVSAPDRVVNAPYRSWVISTFGVTIPETALEIVANPAEMGDEDTDDPFCRFVNRLIS